jgi:hypothetical protein
LPRATKVSPPVLRKRDYNYLKLQMFFPCGVCREKKPDKQGQNTATFVAGDIRFGQAPVCCNIAVKTT